MTVRRNKPQRLGAAGVSGECLDWISPNSRKQSDPPKVACETDFERPSRVLGCFSYARDNMISYFRIVPARAGSSTDRVRGGTPLYMAPEATGACVHPEGKVLLQPEMDIYALGLIMLSLLQRVTGVESTSKVSYLDGGARLG